MSAADLAVVALPPPGATARDDGDADADRRRHRRHGEPMAPSVGEAATTFDDDDDEDRGARPSDADAADRVTDRTPLLVHRRNADSDDGNADVVDG